jgi:hypothetical protein
MKINVPSKNLLRKYLGGSAIMASKRPLGGKKILTFNLIFTLLLSFIHSGNAQAFSVTNTPNATHAINGTVSLATQTVIKVSFASVNQQIILSQPSLSVACKVSNLTQSEKDLVQTPASLNLNQPADCFSIKSVAPVAMVMTLAVKNLAINNPKIVVAIQTQKFEAPDLQPSPVDAQRLPILPSIMFAFGVAAVSLRSKISQRVSKFKLSNSLEFSSYRLQVLRC